MKGYFTSPVIQKWNKTSKFVFYDSKNLYKSCFDFIFIFISLLLRLIRRIERMKTQVDQALTENKQRK